MNSLERFCKHAFIILNNPVDEFSDGVEKGIDFSFRNHSQKIDVASDASKHCCI
jgi:hypothetical protein